MNGPARQTIYTVWEQYPHRQVAVFLTLLEAEVYVTTHRGDMALPLITSKEVAQDTFEAMFWGSK